MESDTYVYLPALCVDSMPVCAHTLTNKPYSERFWDVKLRVVTNVHHTSQMVEMGVGFRVQLDISYLCQRRLFICKSYLMLNEM